MKANIDPTIDVESSDVSCVATREGSSETINQQLRDNIDNEKPITTSCGCGCRLPPVVNVRGQAANELQSLPKCNCGTGEHGLDHIGASNSCDEPIERLAPEIPFAGIISSHFHS